MPNDDDFYCRKHACKKKWLITSSYCPECEATVSDVNKPKYKEKSVDDTLAESFGIIQPTDDFIGLDDFIDLDLDDDSTHETQTEMQGTVYLTPGAIHYNTPPWWPNNDSASDTDSAVFYSIVGGPAKKDPKP